MIEPKMSLILVLPGSTLISQQVAENKPKLKNKKHSKKSKVKKLETDFIPKKAIPAKQVLKMSKEAYYYMLETSTNSKYNKIVAKSKGKPVRAWDTMSEDIRIKKHCELIARDFGAIDFSFNVLED